MHERAEQDLELIRRIMDESRREVSDRGKHFLIWGTLTLVGLVQTYLVVVGIAAWDPAWAWAVILVVGWAASLVVGYRDGRQARVRTLGRRMLSWVWVTVAVTLTLVAVAGLFGGVVGYRALPGLLSVVIAAPVFLTAQLTGERWLGWVAVAWWVGGAVMLFLPGIYTLLLMAGMALALMAVPGAVLYARSRRGSAGREGSARDGTTGAATAPDARARNDAADER